MDKVLCRVITVSLPGPLPNAGEGGKVSHRDARI
jgi:hypothetical protein